MISQLLPGFYDELEKISEAVPEKSKKQQVASGFVTTRPYVVGALKTGIPAGLFGKMVIGGEGAKADRVGRILGLTGAGVGAADVAMRNWAARNKKKNPVAKKLTEQVKTAAMAGDLRQHGIAGVKRPPMPTEDSKTLATKRFNLASKPGAFAGKTEPRHLQAPGPSINQISSLPTG